MVLRLFMLMFLVELKGHSYAGWVTLKERLEVMQTLPGELASRAVSDAMKAVSYTG